MSQSSTEVSLHVHNFSHWFLLELFLYTYTYLVTKTGQELQICPMDSKRQGKRCWGTALQASQKGLGCVVVPGPTC